MMTSGLQTRLKLFALSAPLLLCLSGCDPLTPPKVTAPPPASKPAAAAVLPVETIRSICLAWFNSLATWQDSDAEQTKDEIDLSIRTSEDVCAKYLAGA
jgi:hypothetical protein